MPSAINRSLLQLAQLCSVIVVMNPTVARVLATEKSFAGRERAHCLPTVPVCRATRSHFLLPYKALLLEQNSIGRERKCFETRDGCKVGTQMFDPPPYQWLASRIADIADAKVYKDTRKSDDLVK